MKNQLPNFFNYKEDKVDAGYEALHDFFLSWTLRCAKEEYKSVDEKIQCYSKRILLHLLNIAGFDEHFVVDVVTKKQSGHIDLLVVVTIKDLQEQIKEYVLNIENKWYTKVSETQLVKYVDILKHTYDSATTEIVNVVLFPDYEKVEESRAICEASAYRILTFEELKDLLTEDKTNNDLFDEFWFNFY